VIDRALLTQAAHLIRQAKDVVSLTGAGISTPSGIPDFRSPGAGLWEKVEPMEVASLQTFRATPEKFYNWIKPLAHTLLAAQPNAAHQALARLEIAKRLTLIITQNIDGLHTRAGSTHVLEVHGNLHQATCLYCYHQQLAEPLLKRWLEAAELPRCEHCGHIMKPNVILFGEQLPARIFAEARLAVKRCDLLLVAGSSLEVFPVAELPLLALAHGARLIVVNHESTFVDDKAEVVLCADVAEVLPQLADEVLG
jgi:NAD-dependent deacetylase